MEPVLEQLNWPSLAQDLALLSVPDSPVNIDVICRTYGLNKDALRHIMSVPRFKSMLADSAEYFKAQGVNAGRLYRTRTLSNALMEKLFRDAMSGEMDNKELLRFFELLLKASGAFTETAPAQVNTQVNVGVSLPLPRGLKNAKLEHATLPA